MTSHRGLPEPLPPLPTSPSGRTPQWVIDEALERQGLSAPADPRRRRRAAGRSVDPGATASDWRRWDPPAPPPDPRRTSWWSVCLVLTLLVGVPVVGGYVLLPYLQDRQLSASAPALPSPPPGEPGPASGATGPAEPGPPVDVSPVAPVPEEDVIVGPSDLEVPAPSQDVKDAASAGAANAYGPPPGVESADRPLGTPPSVPDTGGYSLLATQTPGDQVVAYDPCRPIHYVVRPDGAPAGGQQLLEQAVAEVSAATGLQFVSDGATTEAPRQDRQPYQPDRYGERWVPVLITWSTPTEYPQLAGEVAGLGGSTSMQVNNSAYAYVTGLIALDTPDLQQTLQHPGGADIVRAVIMHELAHVLGLGHVEDPTQLMYGQSTERNTTLSAGDRAGLARLGAGQCVPQL
ncbi:matrixin family metalloprotease [Kocuria sediminis]|uniref:Matrixin family metalloprotease n=1 Tax=Kocuria sediminis TaxID=1038857 RepID=A0A6N8GMD5_9MICC|nr:matrixin family metalloprotease [Kocuria sediminis]MUN63427.1 matrixin family metalloprotease [Kocuria sediminis]